MRPMIAPAIGLGVGALVALSAAVTAQAAPPTDWSNIPTATVKLFYPGQSGDEWLRSSAHKRAY